MVEGLGESEEVDVSELNEDKEGFLLNVVGEGRVIVGGSDKDGRGYGVVEVCGMMGVWGWEWWGDGIGEKKEELGLGGGLGKVDYGEVGYGGIFMNDEDWGVSGWRWKDYEGCEGKGEIGGKRDGGIFEVLVGLGGNRLWGGMDGCWIGLFFREGNKEMGDKYGIYVGSCDCEGMMGNGKGEWKRGGKGEYEYVEKGKNVLCLWEEGVKEVGEWDDI